SPSRATSTQTIMLYPARGAATVWESGALAGGHEAAVEALLGAPRVRLLTALRSPATTTALARRLGVTPSAVSQHLAVLHPVGLARLEGSRSGGAAAHRRARVRRGGRDGAVRLRLRPVRVLPGRRCPGLPAADPAGVHRAGFVRRARGRARGRRQPGGAARR